MRKTGLLLFMVVLGVSAILAQDELKQGDLLAANGFYDGAADMYRKCMDTNEGCVIGYCKLLYDGKITASSPNELFQLINPLAQRGNTEAQYYLGMLYRRGIGGVEKDNNKADIWLRLSASKDNENAKNELTRMSLGQGPGTIQETQNTNNSGEMRVSLDQLLQSSKSQQKKANILFIIGGIAAAGGTAAAFLIPAKEIDEPKDKDGKPHYVSERRMYYMIGGCVIGGICIGTGIALKNKKSIKVNSMASEFNNYSLPIPQPTNDARLNLVATDNGAGFRITF